MNNVVKNISARAKMYLKRFRLYMANLFPQASEDLTLILIKMIIGHQIWRKIHQKIASFFGQIRNDLQGR